MLPSLHLLVIVTDAGCRHRVLQLGKPNDKVFKFSFNVFASLGWIRQRDGARFDGDVLRSIS